MQLLSIAKHSCIISLLNSGTSAHQIHHLTGASTGAISKIHSEYCPNIPKSSGGHPCKLTPANLSYAQHFIRMQKADNAAQLTKTLSDVTNQSISSMTVH